MNNKHTQFLQQRDFILQITSTSIFRK